MKFFRQFGRLHLEWIGCLIISIFILWLSHPTIWVQNINHWWFDKVLLSQDSSNSKDIVIITIDDSSLEKLGAWPWPRSIHAQLLKQLLKTQPKNIAINILFSEPSNDTNQDQELESALLALKNAKIPVYLPVSSTGIPDTSSTHQNLQLNQPIPQLASAVEGLGHTLIHLDEDGKVRKMYLWEGNTASPLWPSLALQMSRVEKNNYFESQINLNKRLQQIQKLYPPELMQTYPQWSLQAPMYLPFSNNENHISKYSYAKILNNEIQLEELNGKHIFIGATAVGIGDQYPSPLDGNYSLMPGIEIHATALDGLLNDKLIKKVNSNLTLIVAFIILLVWSFLLWFLTPSKSIIFLIFIIVLIICSNYVLHWSFLYDWPITLNLISIVIPYGLWNWRRFSFLILQLNKRAQILFVNKNKNEERLNINSYNTRDGWQSILQSLDSGLKVQHNRKMFLANTIQAMPEAVFLTDTKGVILLSNERANVLTKQDIILGGVATQLLDIYYDKNKVNNWSDLIKIAIEKNGIEIDLQPSQIKDYKTLLLRAHSAQFINTALEQPNQQMVDSNNVVGWIVTMVDITWQKKLQQQRDQALQLLSHDFRAPQSALLHLVLMQERQLQEMRNKELVANENILSSLKTTDQMRVQINTTLKLADDFVWLLRAQSDEYVQQEINLENLLQQVSDRAWPLAHAKNIQIKIDLLELNDKLCYLMAEANLLERALFNLVENSIKYSFNHTKIIIKVHINNQLINIKQSIKISISDQGKGIPKTDIPYLFQKYTRFHQADLSSKGHGLGLAFVYNVVKQHGGLIECFSEENKGTEFLITLDNAILLDS
jgi:CHASE2 domain-containing sensor protein/signal transduction histidine kinase